MPGILVIVCLILAIITAAAAAYRPTSIRWLAVAVALIALALLLEHGLG